MLSQWRDRPQVLGVVFVSECSMKNGRHNVVALRGKSGFSLTEMVFSISVLALALIFIIAVFTKMLASTSKGQDMTAATYLAQSELDKMLNDPALLRSRANSGIFTYTADTSFTDSLNKTTYFFHINTTPLIYSATDAQLYYVEANIYWWGGTETSPSAMREGIGKTTLQLSRLYYLRN